MNPQLERRIAQIASDRESGASEIVPAVIAVLREAQAAGEDLPAVCRALRRAQPSMAPVWNATQAALNGQLDRFAEQIRRAPDALARIAVETLEIGMPPGAALRCVTLSYSSTVAQVLERLVRRRPVSVACSEGRPALEGRRLAARLAAAGLTVAFYTDAAIATALERADVVLVGADAVAAHWFINKSGTLMLAAAAMRQGVPVFALAGREKFVDDETAAQMPLRSGPPAEVWDAGRPGLVVENPYFERVPLELTTGVLTDAGLIPVGEP